MKQIIQEQLNVAIREKNETRKGTLRGLISAIQTKEKENSGDIDYTSILMKEANRRKEAIGLYKEANATELLESETKQLEIIMEFLPSQMSETEMTRIVESIINDNNLSGKSAMGTIMKTMNSLYSGQFDSKLLGKIANSILG